MWYFPFFALTAQNDTPATRQAPASTIRYGIQDRLPVNGRTGLGLQGAERGEQHQREAGGDQQGAAGAGADPALEPLERLDRLLFGVVDDQLPDVLALPDHALSSSAPGMGDLSTPRAGPGVVPSRPRAARPGASDPLVGRLGGQDGLAVDGPDRGQRGDLERGHGGVVGQLDVQRRAGFAQLGGEGERAAEEGLDVVQRHGRRGRVVPVLDLGPGVRVVLQPLRSTRMRRVPTAASAERPSGNRSIWRMRATVPTVGAHVAAADLTPPLDEDHAELAVARLAVVDQRPVAGLEDVQRQHEGREEDRAEREHGQGARSSRDGAGADLVEVRALGVLGQGEARRRCAPGRPGRR